MEIQPRLATESIAGRRPYQEDAVLAKALSDGRIVVAVADGMGGNAAGDVASALAMETLVQALEDGQALGDAFTLANSRVHSKSREPGKQGMGSTMVAAVIDGATFTVANVGDSRCYLLGADGIKQISEDHSFVAEAMKCGQSEEEALSSRFKDVLTRSIGIDEQVKADTFGPYPVENNTALFLCSDGLYKVMTNARIRELFGGSGGPRGAAQSMVATAYEDGSDDNISIALAEFGEVKRDRAKGRCSEGDFDRAEATLERMSAGAGAIREYEEFIELAANVSPSSAELQAAVDDATQRIAGVRARIRG